MSYNQMPQQGFFQCARCGAPLQQNNPYCSSCGFMNQQQPYYPQQQSYYPQQPYYPGYPPQGFVDNRQYSGTAIAGFVISLVCLFFPIIALFYIGELLALVLSAVGMNDCAKNNKRGRGLGIAGLVISITFMVLVLIALLAADSIVRRSYYW
ncbi:MAG: DUF4190 domain-containing protein [Clostridiales bacterium]|nr:DUF4190 domain-containing protein [Clostridiales bacterium]